MRAAEGVPGFARAGNGSGMIRMCSPVPRAEVEHPSLESARAAVAALDLVGLPAAVLGRAARIIATNASFERIRPDLVREPRTQLQLADAAAHTQLSDALTCLSSRHARHGMRSIPLAAAGGQPPLILHLASLHGARDLFRDAVAILVVCPIVPKEAPSATVLQGLFNLTPAEARVARGVAQGHTVDRIAAGLGLSQETVRSQLKAVLAKTGAARNIDLAALLAGAIPPASREPE
jgi:DNA-binding CsgD family transcriptional regulator